MAKLYTLTIRNRAAAIVFAIAILGLGAVFLTVGLALLAGLAVAGGLLGVGFSVFRRLRGGSANLPSSSRLDPSLEVEPDRPAIMGQAENDTE